MSDQPFCDFLQYLLDNPSTAREWFADPDLLEAEMTKWNLTDAQRQVIRDADDAGCQALWEADCAPDDYPGTFADGVNFR